MPRWSACVRTLARSNRSPISHCPPNGRWAIWPPLRAARTTSSTVSERNPRDDTTTSPPATHSPFHSTVASDSDIRLPVDHNITSDDETAPTDLAVKEDDQAQTPSAYHTFSPFDVTPATTSSLEWMDPAPKRSTLRFSQTLGQHVPGTSADEAADVRLRNRIKVWTLRRGPMATQSFYTASQEALLQEQGGKWIDEIERMRPKFGNVLTEGRNLEAGNPILLPQTAEWVDAALDRMDGGKLTLDRSDFPSPEIVHPNAAWTEMVLWLLAYDKPRVLDFLLATHELLCPNDIYLVDALRFMVAHYHLSSTHEKEKQLPKLIHACCELAKPIHDTAVHMTGWIVHMLLRYCSVDQALQLFHAFEKWQTVLTPASWLHFVRRFSDNNHYHDALRAMGHARANGVPVTSVAFRSCCSIVLRSSVLQPDGLRETLRVISSMVDMGIELDNIIFFNIIILNAVEVNDIKTALDVYHSLKERQLEPDRLTFVALLEACKRNVDDVQMLNDIIHDTINSSVSVRSEPMVADNILHALALHHSQHHPSTALKTLVEAYAQFYDLEPLQRLGMPVPSTPSGASRSQMAPTTHALNFLVGAAIEDILLKHPTHGPKAILPLYTRWYDLVAAGNPAFVPTATSDYIFNNFLAAFIRQPDSLVLAARLVKHMQTPFIPAIAGVTQAKPSVYTWSIFLHGFTRHGKMQLAEQVRTFMQKEGIPENFVTWNTLMYGYARHGSVGGVLDVLKKGFPDEKDWTGGSEGALKKLRRTAGRSAREIDRELVRRGFRSEGRVVDFTADLKRRLAGRIEGQSPSTEHGWDTKVSDVWVGEERPDRDDGFSDSPADLAESETSYRPL